MMNRGRFYHAVGLALAILVVLAGSDSFDEADKDHDGKLSRAELEVWKDLHKAKGAEAGVHGGGLREREGAIVLPEKPFGPFEVPLSASTSGSGFLPALINSILMIFATELGDKTFFIAAILAMKHPRAIVFLGTYGALIIMTVLSVAMGSILTLLPHFYTHYAGALMFLYFGVKMLYDSREMQDNVPSEELSEVEEQLNAKKTDQETNDMEGGSWEAALKDKQRVKIFSQAFTLTFLAEWGDRSQIATIALAASKNALGVTLGSILGHGFCTGMAVLGGRLLASRISEKTVTIVGGVLFLLFALHSFVVGPDE